ncbi:MAG: type I 3-dehydroquinate dehydratase [Archaeoglobaceae archaeon]
MKIVVSATSTGDIEATRDVADIVELRLDLFESLPSVEEVQRVEKPSIITIRRKKEGGAFEGDEEQRLELFNRFCGAGRYAGLIDVEYDSDERFFDLPGKIIESYHNFEETPSYQFLKDLVENRRGQIFKIACLGRSKQDVLNVVNILANYDNVVAFLMGEDFAFTRIMAAFMGSPFIYCHSGNAVAKGQIEAHQAYEAIKILRGEK